MIDDGIAYKFFQLADRGLHPGGFGYKLVGTVIESFTIDPATDTLYPAGGHPVGVADSAGSDPLIWGAATLAYHGYIYIYGVKPYQGGSDQYPLYLARVPAGGLAAGDAWQYFDGTPGCPGTGGWTADPAAAVPLRSGVSAGFSVTAVGGRLVLLTNDMSGAGSQNDAVAYYAGCPAGFSPGSPRYLVYQPQLPPGYLAYEYRVVPQFSHGASVLVSYSVSTTSLAGNFQIVSRYRPHFLDVRLPATGPGRDRHRAARKGNHDFTPAPADPPPRPPPPAAPFALVSLVPLVPQGDRGPGGRPCHRACPGARLPAAAAVPRPRPAAARPPAGDEQRRSRRGRPARSRASSTRSGPPSRPGRTAPAGQAATASRPCG